MRRKEVPILLAAVLLLLVLGCGGGGKATPTPIIIVVTPDPGQSETLEASAEPGQPEVVAIEATEEPGQTAAGVEVLGAVFAHGLTEEMAPVDPGSDFGSSETVHLSVELKGRPKEGQVLARFYWLDTFISDAAVDLADANSGVIFSIGENTFAGFSLSHEEAWPLGGGYRAELFLGDQALGSYPFRIAPPAGAIPSQVREAVLARGADENYNPIEPTTQFAPDELVYVVGRGDLGQESWIQADWYAGGQLDEAGTRSVTLEENASDAGFSFSFLPEAGWPPGEQYVVLTLDGQEIGRYPFAIVSSGGAAPLDETAFWETFPLPEDAEVAQVVEGYDLGFATAMVEPELFDAYAAWLGDQGWQQQAPTEAMETLPHQVWRKDGAELLMEIQGLDDLGRTVAWLQLKQIGE